MPIADNVGSDAGGGGYNVKAINCTIVSNTSGGSGGGGINALANLANSLTNCIVYGNTPNNFRSAYTYSVADTCTTPRPTRPFSPVPSGNTDLDPQFAGADFQLQKTSPCIDAGTDLTAANVTNDLLGVVRPQDGNASGTAEFS